MTVHGAKGLEAPIVILPDTAKRKREVRGDLLVDDQTVYWKPKSEIMPDMLNAVKEAMLAARDREQRRLLYVALTRAESWLIIAAAGEAGTGQDSWHATLTDAMGHLDCIDHIAPFGPIKRLTRGDWDAGDLMPAPQTDAKISPVPEFDDALPDIPQRVVPRSPSDLGSAKVMAGEVDDTDTEQSLAWGRIIHLLLELLPEIPAEKRAALGQSIIQNHADAGLLHDHAALLAEAMALLDTPELAWLFETGMAEVPISANLAALGGQRISGIIDRLILSDDTVIAIDYKTNQVTPTRLEDTPLGLVRQMAAYRDALVQIYPSHHIRTIILWTKTGAFTELDDETLDNALAGLS
jgi:ATP-dependent helicase/nuclease subunit A